MTKIVQIKPGFKPSPIGPIPADWEVKKFMEVAKFYSGGTPHTSRTEYYTGDIPFIKSGEIYFDKTAQCISFEGLNTSSAKMVNKGDLLYALYGANSGEVAISKIRGAINQAILCIKPNDVCDRIFIYNFLLNKKESIIKNYLQGGQGNLSAEIIKSLSVPLPPLLEQQKIATILSTWDTAIFKTQQLIDQLKERNRGLQQQLLTGKKRVNGFEKTKWVKISAESIFKSISTKNNNGNEQLLSVTQDRGAIPRDMLEGRVTMPSGDTNSFKLVEPGDFIISLRSFQGGLEFSEYRGLVSPAYTVLKPIKAIDNNFYKYYFKSYDFIGHLAVAVIGIRDGKQISFDDFCTVKLPYPSSDEQSKIAEVLSAADNEVKIQVQKLETLKQQKKGLMHQLLTGIIRV